MTTKMKKNQTHGNTVRICAGALIDTKIYHPFWSIRTFIYIYRKSRRSVSNDDRLCTFIAINRIIALVIEWRKISSSRKEKRKFHIRRKLAWNASMRRHNFKFMLRILTTKLCRGHMHGSYSRITLLSFANTQLEQLRGNKCWMAMHKSLNYCPIKLI